MKSKFFTKTSRQSKRKSTPRPPLRMVIVLVFRIFLLLIHTIYYHVAATRTERFYYLHLQNSEKGCFLGEDEDFRFQTSEIYQVYFQKCILFLI